MSRGRRKKNSTWFGSSTRTSSRHWSADGSPLRAAFQRPVRIVRPYWVRQCAAFCSSQVAVDVFEADSLGKHHHLQVVQQLGNFLCGGFIRFVLGGHPHFGGFFHYFLANGVDASIELFDGSRPFGAGASLIR